MADTRATASLPSSSYATTPAFNPSPTCAEGSTTTATSPPARRRRLWQESGCVGGLEQHPHQTVAGLKSCGRLFRQFLVFKVLGLNQPEQGVAEQVRVITVDEPELELIKVTFNVLLGNLMVSADDGTLEQRPRSHTFSLTPTPGRHIVPAHRLRILADGRSRRPHARHFNALILELLPYPTRDEV